MLSRLKPPLLVVTHDVADFPGLGARRRCANVTTVTRKPIPLRQSRLTLFALRHPLWLAVASGVVIFIWTMVVVRDWRAAFGVDVGLAIVVGYLSSRWGWARRREERLYDENGVRRSPDDLV